MSRPPKRKPSAVPFVPATTSLEVLREAAQNCRGCNLYLTGTQTVFGEGTNRAEIMLVGEQPGDREDEEGRPFIGPAGRLLDHCLHAAGIDRSQVYVTNAVKHFKWEPRGKRRIHQKPNPVEVAACRPWFEAEVAAVRPRLIVCLGATAAQSLMGRLFRVTQHRGEIMTLPQYPPILTTIHPSAILRATEDRSRRIETDLFIEDLRKAATYLESSKLAA